MSTDWMDFNDAAESTTEPEAPVKLDPKAIKSALLHCLPSALAYLFPNGKARNGQLFIGDMSGNEGKSLVVELDGQKAGLWHDFNTGESGDIFDAWAYHERLDCQSQFPEVLAKIAEWLGTPSSFTSTPTTKKASAPIDELGPVTAKWDYFDKTGKLIACVYRYDPPSGKEFRPWDVIARKQRAPDPRPLYNQQGIGKAQHVILVEGEKCADALINQKTTATTAMNGANAPIDKTDWSPLKGKDVTIWPDHDEAGSTYAEKAAEAIAKVGAKSVTVLKIPQGKPAKWDAADAVDDNTNVDEFINTTSSYAQPVIAPLHAFTLGELLADESPIPDDLIEPRVLTPGGMVVFGGAPKVGKSDFVLSWLTYMAAGEPFLDMKPSRRLRVFYLQAEVQYHYLRERLKSMNLPELQVWRASENLYITPQLRLILNDEGMDEVKGLLRKASEKEPIDIIVIDPLRNLFDGGEDGASENDNQAMLFFLKQRVEKLRDSVNPNAGIILVHHTKKLAKRQLIEDPFLAFSGASSLRGYYTTGMLLYRPEESQSPRVVTFELRNGPPLQDKFVDKKHGKWTAIDRESERLINQDHGEKLDAERRRKKDTILQLIFDEAALGRVYTIAQFGEAFEGRAGLGAERTIRDRLSVLATKGYIKFFCDGERYGLAKLTRSKFGYMCVESMQLITDEEDVDLDTGEISQRLMSVFPTTYKCPQTGASLPVENPQTWIYQEEEVNEE